MKSSTSSIDWGESSSAPKPQLGHTGAVFETFFERSVDAVWLLDQQAGVSVDCNQAAVELIGAENKHQLLPTRQSAELTELCAGASLGSLRFYF